AFGTVGNRLRTIATAPERTENELGDGALSARTNRLLAANTDLRKTEFFRQNFFTPADRDELRYEAGTSTLLWKATGAADCTLIRHAISLCYELNSFVLEFLGVFILWIL